MFTALLVQRVRPLVIALLTLLTVLGGSASVAVASLHHSPAQVGATRWCLRGAPGCPLKITVAP